MNFSKTNQENETVNKVGVSRSLRTVALALVFAINGFAFANNPTGLKVTKTIGQEVIELLSVAEADLNMDRNAVVEFEINDKNEIVISDVQTDSYFLKSFIIRHLNKEKIKNAVINTNETYKVLLKFRRTN
ncbi:MAG: hypothetical protein HRU50_01110 [Winogradskyella sp.]|uniref:hypothetical protein n=1 Tax=Winogradskyella sp. TaxID=1883156 RepID=UPI0025FC46BB|nr:hypothetical protein [Winogradskyella sp.]NRB58521.1 hypothetical protein [Winogradskyella sp.]